MDLPLPRTSRLAWQLGALVGVTCALIAGFLAFPWLGMNAGIAAHDELAWLDPDNAFVYIYAHHAVQAIAALAVAGALIVGFGWAAEDFGFRRGDTRLALRVTAVFALVFGLVTAAFDLVPPLVTGVAPTLGYGFTPGNVLAMLVFDWVVVGVSEEVLFRGFALGAVRRVCRGRIRVGAGRASANLSIAGVIVAVLFAVEHALRFGQASFLDISFVPNWSQIGLAFVLGIYYAELRERTGSLLGPILSHNISDGLVVTATYLATALTAH